MISLIMPSESWVARWNDLQSRMPGVYAMHILDNDIEFENDRLGAFGSENEEYKDDGWIVDDGDGEEVYR